MIGHKKYVVIGGILLTTAVVVGVGFFILKPNLESASAHKEALKTSENKMYSEFTDAERDARAKEETGYTAKELQNKTLDTTVLPDPDKAYSAAQILAGAGDYKKSLEAFQLAKDKKDTQGFYNNYTEAALLAGDDALATKLMKEQLEILKGQDVKDEIAISRLEDMIVYREANL